MKAKQEVIGYKVIRSVTKGDIIASSDITEPVYRDLDPLDELVELAKRNALIYGEPELIDRINWLERKVRRNYRG